MTDTTKPNPAAPVPFVATAFLTAAFLTVACLASAAHAETVPWDDATAEKPARPRAAEPAAAEGAFDRSWALAAYAAGVEGDYSALGVGGRLRWEPLPFFGMEVFAETTWVEWPGASRQDVPLGFNLYVPFSLTDWLRVRAMAGLCVSFSFIESAFDDRTNADDVRFGIHAGGGVELALGDRVSIFLDAQWFGYLGHDRSVDDYSAALADALTDEHALQFDLGLTIHL